VASLFFISFYEGFYVPVRNKIDSILARDTNKDSGFLNKVLAAIITGTIGSLVANPVDVIKIRLMGNPLRYKSLSAGLFDLYTTEGLAGLTKGIVPSTLRGACIAVGELATYDHAKVVLKEMTALNEGPWLHLGASLITGLVATSVAAPFDLIKSR